jgi:hypothetical protein
MRYSALVPIASLALILAGALALMAQDKPTEVPVTRSDAQAMLALVSQEVWHAQNSSTGYGRVQQEYIEGERAYFRGDYAEAVKHLSIAQKTVQGIPNDLAPND